MRMFISATRVLGSIQVAKSAAAHILFKISRIFNQSQLSRQVTPRCFTVLFIIGEGMEKFESVRYRVSNIQEYMEIAGIESESIYMSQLTSKMFLVKKFDLIVIFRAHMTSVLEKVIREFRLHGVPVIYDIDDYVFEPAIIDQIDGILGWNQIQKAKYIKGVKGYRSTLLASDYFTTTTHFLKERAEEIGVKSFVIPNALNSYQLDTSIAEIHRIESKINKTKDLLIGYFSGTATHQKDFSVAVHALADVLDRYSEVRLLICGFLDLEESPELSKFSDRIDRKPFVSWKELPNILNMVDIHLAPLQAGNPFCEAKSELKYFEAAILKKPVIASPIQSFLSTIKNGVNGFIAYNDNDWKLYLSRLIEDPVLRQRIGESAYQYVLEKYSPAAMAAQVRHVYSEIIRNFLGKRSISEKSLSITFVVPPPFSGSGGHNKIFSIAAYLSKAGHFVKVCITNPTLDFVIQRKAAEFIQRNFRCSGFGVTIGVDSIHSCDALVATQWSTAYVVGSLRKRAAKLFYFVQDYEPLFYPMGSEYLKAANTYMMGLHHISIGQWCAEQLRTRHHAKVDWIPFPIDRGIYYKRKGLSPSKRKRIIFFARPDMPRRCFDLGIEALSLLYKKHPEVDIVLFGSSRIRSWLLRFPHENLGVLSPSALAELYSSAYAGIAFNTTNPSMVPYEMMACECPVIDLDIPGNDINYGSKNNVQLVGIDPEEIVQGIEKLLSDVALRDMIAINGFRYVQTFPDEGDFFKQFENILIQNVNQVGKRES